MDSAVSTDEDQSSPDDLTRLSVGDMPVPEFPNPAFVRPGPLAQSRIAVVTTAGLLAGGQERWVKGDQTFRVIPDDAEGLILGHGSPNYDRLGFLADPNVVIPRDRLHELADEGVIGSVAARHISFVGNQDETMTTIRLDSGPAAAALLKEDGVDVVLLTPVCPLCSRTCGTLAHVLEAQGLSTVTISLVSGVSERLKPPRTLYCRFPFGRPLGRPNDPGFQRDVVLATLDLLSEKSGPVLRDYPIAELADGEVLTCTVAPRLDLSLPVEVDEAIGLRPAYDRQLSRSGRTTLGRTTDAAGIADIIRRLITVRDGAAWDETGLPPSTRDVAADVRSYYEEAALALSDHTPSAHAGEDWLFTHTATGQLLRDVQQRLKATVPDSRELWFYMVPRAYQ